jgi:hypothetical protein
MSATRVEDLPDYEDIDEIYGIPSIKEAETEVRKVPTALPSANEVEAEIRKVLSEHGPLAIDIIAERLGPYHHNNSVIIN